MHLRVPTPPDTTVGPINLDIDERKTPVACRCLQYQILKNAWSGAQLVREAHCVKLVGSSFTPTLGEERPTPLQRGSVSFGESTNELIFWTSSEKGPHATVLAQLSPSELDKLDALPTPEAEPSQQLQEAMEFEQLLAQHDEAASTRSLRSYE